MDPEKLLLDICRSIVDTPDKVALTRNETEDEITFVITVDPDEMGMVIGRHGKIAKAIRTVVKAASAGLGKKVSVDIR
ncbi:MAG: KH domain-containing protein [Clostridia bacterium]|nr:KH domain-containing protein [Clostridia bacterium]MBP5173754.1 KH domain-containing protein [Clostridia bacterium]